MDAVIGAIGFTAYATTDMSFGSLQTVIFDGVVSNYGGAYDSTTGEFTCPVTGLAKLLLISLVFLNTQVIVLARILVY